MRPLQLDTIRSSSDLREICMYLGPKGQIISKANCQAMNSSKKRTNEFVFTTMRHVFVRFLEEIEDTKKSFRN